MRIKAENLDPITSAVLDDPMVIFQADEEQLDAWNEHVQKRIKYLPALSAVYIAQSLTNGDIPASVLNKIHTESRLLDKYVKDVLAGSMDVARSAYDEDREDWEAAV